MNISLDNIEAVNFNGVACDAVVFNGVKVWEAFKGGEATFNAYWNIRSEIFGLEFLDASGNVLKNIPAAGTYKIRKGEGTTRIEGNSFRECTSLTSITIPNGITNINYYAFSFCRNLTSITIPNSVTNFGNYVFRDCRNLTSIIMLPKTPPTLGLYVFDGTPSNAKVYVPRVSAVAGKYGTVGSKWKGLTVAVI